MFRSIWPALVALFVAAVANANDEGERATGSLPYLANAASLIVEAAGITRFGTTENGSSLIEAEVREVLKGDLRSSKVTFLVPWDLADDELRPSVLFLDENYAKTLGGKQDQPDYVVVSGRHGIVSVASPDRLPALRGYLAASSEQPDEVLRWAVDHTNSTDLLLSVASFYELARLLPVEEEEPDLFPAYWGLSDPPRRELLEEVAAVPEDAPIWHYRYSNPWGTEFLDQSTPELFVFLQREDTGVAKRLGALSSLASRDDNPSRRAIHDLIVNETFPLELRKAALISIATQTSTRRGDMLLEIQRDLSPTDPLVPYLDVLEP